MAYVLAKFEVDDFDSWKAGFETEEGAAFRKQAGQKSYQVFRSVDDPKTAFLLVEWGDLENARKQAESAELAEVHRQSGGGPLDLTFLEEAGSGTVC